VDCGMRFSRLRWLVRGNVELDRDARPYRHHAPDARVESTRFMETACRVRPHQVPRKRHVFCMKLLLQPRSAGCRDRTSMPDARDRFATVSLADAVTRCRKICIPRKISRVATNPPMTEQAREPAHGRGTHEVIDVADPKNVIYWCTRLRCTDEELRFVVKHYGAKATDIEAFFARCRY